jgi:metallophosphoesterase (TIGR00282 family)
VKELNLSEYSILFLGDIVGKPGRTVVREGLPSLVETYQPLFVIANGENSAGGVGISPDIAEDLFKWGVDAITLGNHAFNKREISGYLDSGKPIVRPSNMPPMTPGKGICWVEKAGIRLAVMNLCGRVFLETYDDPFREVDRLVAEAGTEHIFVDFHAEATSEKITMGFHLEGRVTAMVGTHTHVTTADEQVLPGGTAYITDVGMCGPIGSVLGMDRDVILQRFRTTLPTKFEVANAPGVISAVLIRVNRDTGRAESISRVTFGP